MRKERRGHPRYDIMAQVRVADGEVTHVLDIGNISMTGVFLIATGIDGVEPLTIGQSLELHIFDAAALDNIRVSGRVTREQTEGGKKGYGVAFEEMDESSGAALSHLVALARQASIHPPPLPSS